MPQQGPALFGNYKHLQRKRTSVAFGGRGGALLVVESSDSGEVYEWTKGRSTNPNGTLGDLVVVFD